MNDLMSLVCSFLSYFANFGAVHSHRSEPLEQPQQGEWTHHVKSDFYTQHWIYLES